MSFPVKTVLFYRIIYAFYWEWSFGNILCDEYKLYY